MMTVPATGYARRFHHPAFRFEDAETEPAAFKCAYPSYKLVLYAGKRRNKHKRAEITFLKNVPLPPAVIAHWQSVLVGAGAPAGHLPVGVYQYSGRFHDSEDNIKRREWMDLLKPSRVSLEAWISGCSCLPSIVKHVTKLISCLRTAANSRVTI
ncbi:MAG: hypothetical protein IPM93_25045 [Candidatus Obscuribacter sp.]|nr:hypothetical protein [Candidatus Obscuribacter sp.]